MNNEQTISLWVALRQPQGAFIMIVEELVLVGPRKIKSYNTLTHGRFGPGVSKAVGEAARPSSNNGQKYQPYCRRCQANVGF